MCILTLVTVNRTGELSPSVLRGQQMALLNNSANHPAHCLVMLSAD